MKDLENILPASVLIVGCGDTGLRAAKTLRAMGREVTGVVRSEQSAAQLRAQGITALALDLDAGAETSEPHSRESGNPSAKKRLSSEKWVPACAGTANLIFYFAPPPNTGTTDPRLRNFLARLPEPPQRLVYISTSGVYGDCGGRWIDEDEPLKPQSSRARRRLDAEQALQEWGGDHVILRVPGIYGPGRLPLERLRQNLPVIRPAESPYTNRIHAEDLALAALHAAARGESGAAYNISDGKPTTMCDYFTRCAALLGLPPPPQVSLEEARRALTPAMWSFMEESKRLLNRRMVEELGFVPRYPDLEHGLKASLEALTSDAREQLHTEIRNPLKKG